MKKIGTWIGAAALALVLTGCDVTQGSSCSQVGSQTTNKDGTLYTCVKNTQTGKGFWYRGMG